MRLSEQFKKKLQKLAGVTPGKKATPKKGGYPLEDYSCPEGTVNNMGSQFITPAITINCDPNIPSIMLAGGFAPEGIWTTVCCDEEEPVSYEYGDCCPPDINDYSAGVGTLTNLCSFCANPQLYSDGEMINSVLGGNFEDSVFFQYCPCCEGAPMCSEETEADCASYPAACCLQQVYGQDIFGTTIEYQGERVNVPSAEECEGFTMTGAGTNSTPYPYPGYTFYDGVTYSHNPNNSFEQGCCYPLV